MVKRITPFLFCAALLCSLAAFGGCDSSENRVMSGIKVVSAPKQTKYELFDEGLTEAGFKTGGKKLTESDLLPDTIREKYKGEKAVQELYDAIDSAEFYLNLNLEGMIVVAQYSDGTNETLKNEDVEVKPTDPADLGELFDKYIEQDTLKKLVSKPDEKLDSIYLESLAKLVKEGICRDYTVQAAYKGFEDEFKVSVFSKNSDWQKDKVTERYEFVRIDDAQGERAVPLSAMNYNGASFDREEEETEYLVTYDLDIETNGMSAVLRDRETGEEVKVPLTEDNSELYLGISCEFGTYPPSGEYEAQGVLWHEWSKPTEKYPKTEQSFEFTYKVFVNNDLG